MTSKVHLVLPDMHVEPGIDLSYCSAIGNFLVDLQPDVVINLGDFADMPSLSSYDVGKRVFEGRRYTDDIDWVRTGMRQLINPLRTLQYHQRQQKKKIYNPRLVMTLGNHEQRIERAANIDSKLFGLIKYEDLGYEQAGWEVYDFLEVVEVDGIHYSHYFTSGVMGNPAASAKALLRAECRSSVMGHVQKMELDWHPKQNFFGLFAGTCYPHEHTYLGRQGNQLKPGLWVLRNVKGDGVAEPQWISLETIMKEYGY